MAKQLAEVPQTSAALLAYYDTLPVVDIAFLLGAWRGSEFDTGHWLEGALESGGWAGKYFKSPEEVHPLLFYADRARSRTFAVWPLRWSFHPWLLALMKSPWGHAFVRWTRPVFGTKKYAARLRMTEYRGKLSATMIYDHLPIQDVFRKVDEHTVLGIMDLKGMEEPYFFVLRRE